MVYDTVKVYKQNFVISPSYREVINTVYNKKAALWHMPYNKEYLNYDEDGTRWFEASNKNGNNEIKKVEKGLDISTSNYIVSTKTTYYDDGTYEVTSKYPNRNTVIENHGINYVYMKIKNKFNQLVAEKFLIIALMKE